MIALGLDSNFVGVLLTSFGDGFSGPGFCAGGGVIPTLHFAQFFNKGMYPRSSNPPKKFG